MIDRSSKTEKKDLEVLGTKPGGLLELDASSLEEGVDAGDLELVRRALSAGIGPDAWEGRVTPLHAAVRAWSYNEHAPMIAIVEALVAAGFDPRAKLEHASRDDDWTSSWKKGDSPVSAAEDLADLIGNGGMWCAGELRDASHAKALLTALGQAP